MPSPLGHALGGIVAGWLVGGPPRAAEPAADALPPRQSLLAALRSPALTRSALGFGLLGILADFDFLFGTHSTYSHSIGAVAIVFASAWAWQAARGAESRAHRAALAASAAYASHILLDWLGTDGAPPIGIMALWPLSGEFYLAGVGVFAPVERRFWLPDFWLRTARMLAIEVAVLVPLLLIVGRGRGVPADLRGDRRT